MKCLSGHCNCMYTFSLLLPLLLCYFEWSAIFSHNLLNVVTYLSLTHLCLASLTLDMNAWHSSKVSFNGVVDDLNSFNNCFSALLIISKLLDNLTIFLSLILTRVMPADKYMSENLGFV